MAPTTASGTLSRTCPRTARRRACRRSAASCSTGSGRSRARPPRADSLQDDAASSLALAARLERQLQGGTFGRFDEQVCAQLLAAVEVAQHPDAGPDLG